ncbi:MAG TPA: hypothetical protein VFT64_08550 [Rickettsiales bacterium]|nr:hypothetical protein [Rickettsiales bacterium]
MIHIEPQLEPLPMRRREMVPVSNNQYRILLPDGEYKYVEATTAYEAFKLSGLKHALKIERLANARSIIVDQTKFKPEQKVEDQSDSLADILKAEADELEQMKKLRNSVISADDLDKIMRSFNVAVNDEPVEASQDSKGTEVHNDGFDEIIPAAPAAKAASPAAKPAPTEQTTQAAPETAAAEPQAEPPVTPEQNLSPEDVEKLLNG